MPEYGFGETECHKGLFITYSMADLINIFRHARCNYACMSVAMHQIMHENYIFKSSGTFSIVVFVLQVMGHLKGLTVLKHFSKKFEREF